MRAELMGSVEVHRKYSLRLKANFLINACSHLQRLENGRLKLLVHSFTGWFKYCHGGWEISRGSRRKDLIGEFNIISATNHDEIRHAAC